MKNFPLPLGMILLLFAGLALAGATWGLRMHPTAPPKLVQAPPPASFPAKVLSPPLPENTQAQIPPNVSPELREFLQNRTVLENKFAFLHNQMLKANLVGNDGGTVADLQRLFRQQNEGLLQRQSQLSKLLAQQQAEKPLPMPPPLKLPPTASPQVKAYLTARDKFERDEVKTMNQYRGLDPKVRTAAIQKWQKANADRLQELRQLAQAASHSQKATSSFGHG